MSPPTDHSQRRALVTGANSGLALEAARQLAQLGYGSVVLACRTQIKADTARDQLRQDTGRDPFSTLVVDVADVSSSREAAAALVERGDPFDAVLLNAGMVPNDLERTDESIDKGIDEGIDEGIEMCFASSLVGHHVLTEALLEADLVNAGASVALVGSGAANNDLPRAMGMSVHDFVLGEDSAFGSSPREAMESFALAASGPKFNGSRQYSSTKAFSAWWSGAMARRHGPSAAFYTVSPGSNMGTNAGRHAKGACKVMIAVMRRFGGVLGIDQPVEEGAKGYIDGLEGEGGPYESGRTYTSPPKKMTGPLTLRSEPHLIDEARQDLSLEVVDDLIESVAPART